MPESSRGQTRLALGLLLAFALLVGLRLHGFSLAAWHAVIDDSPPREVLLGKSRSVRADDWRLILPLAFAQSEHEPRFPLVNRNIGLGQPMAVPLQVPIGAPLGLFRPTLWGFALGPDLGTAWLWWSSALGLFGVLTGVLRVATGAGLGLASAGALAVLFSPFFQFWSLNFASVAIYAGIAFLAGAHLLVAERRPGILSAGALLGWAGGCFLLVLYPPFQVPLAWLVLVLLTAFLWERRRDPGVRRHLPVRAAAVVVAVAAAGAAAGLLWLEAGDAIRTLSETAYPGARVSTGGMFSWWRLFSHNLAYAWQVETWGPFGNISSAGSFALFFPVVALGLVLSRSKRDVFTLAVLAYCIVLALYATVGFPVWLARVTGFSFVETPRAVIGLGLADAVLLVRFVTRGRETPPPGKALPVAGALLFTAALLFVAFRLGRALPGLSLAWLCAAALANGVVAWLVLDARRPALVLSSLALAAVASTIWFNPLARGGATFLRDNPLSQRILAIDREHEGRSLWLVMGSPAIANLLPAIGVHSLTGTQPVPQLELWRHFDPEGLRAQVYNRYAHVLAEASDGPGIGIRLQSEDAVVLTLAPDAPVLRSLGVTHLVVTEAGEPSFGGRRALRHLGSEGPHHLYALTPAPGVRSDGSAPSRPTSPPSRGRDRRSAPSGR